MVDVGRRPGSHGGYLVGGRVGVAVHLCPLQQRPSLFTSIPCWACGSLYACARAYFSAGWRPRARTLVPLPYVLLLVLALVGIPLPHLVPLGLLYVCFAAVVCSLVVCGSLLSFACGCPSYHTSFRVDGLESIRGSESGGLVLAAVTWSTGTLLCGGSLVSLPALARTHKTNGAYTEEQAISGHGNHTHHSAMNR